MHQQKDLPAHVELLTDYEGEGVYTSVASAAQQDLLCRRFDQIVRDRAETPADSTTTRTSPTAAVLFSCFGLVPTSGTIFLSYDIVPDVPNFGQFVRKALAPPGWRATAVSQGGARSGGGKSDSGERDGALRRPKEKAPRPEGEGDCSALSLDESRITEAGRLKEVPAYRHLLLLLRPNEVKGMLRHLRLTGEALNLTYTPLAHRPSQASYRLAAEKLKSLNKKLFPIQNSAFQAYKTTMKAYSGVGPRDVYDEKQLNLEKVAEEFGFTELPLLDLRLRDNSFRPKEDLYKLSRKKQAEERRAYKRFAESNIPIDP
ncbi:unnamed protein product [Phytomonas sp. EM1]|nr:unnamed protein product [Phytomonas sp. EM1]|eukprot:CCW65885.1 unnamed protein product [Phytomonas sp. isolate EM1]